MNDAVACSTPAMRALTIAVVDEPEGTVALIRADFKSHPPLLMKVRAKGARTVVKGGNA